MRWTERWKQKVRLGPSDYDAENNAETGHARVAVKKASVHNICKCVRKIDDQGSETHGSTGNLCRYFHLIHRSEEDCAHGKYNRSKAQGAGRAKNPVAVLAKHFVRYHQERCHCDSTYKKTDTDVFGRQIYVLYQT